MVNEKRIFNASADNFNDLAIELFNFQYLNSSIYHKFCEAINADSASVNAINKIPFLPISFFKTHAVKSTEFEAQTIFESSGTTQANTSKHHIKDIGLYRQSFTACFEKFYGLAKYKCILGLLPSYLQNKNSSLVMMTEDLILQSGKELSGFYLDDFEKLHRTLVHNELLKMPAILIGVTYALLDYAEQYPMQLRHTIIMETGGMKGRRTEMTREEVHASLIDKLGVPLVHSEYGMTELLSQAYSKGDGIFHCPAWMKILIRDEDDPFNVMTAADANNRSITGLINVIDLANIYSCSFIATDDVGRLHANESFEVLGRMDRSDVRGCSLMSV